MATLSRARTLGGIGAVLVLIPVVSIVGYLLIIISVRDISRALEDKAIFRNILVAAGAGMVGALAAFYAIFEAGGSSGLDASLEGLAVAWVFLLVSAVFLRRSYGELARRLGVRNFARAGTLYLVGAGLTIIVIGLILLLAAQIVQAIAFYSVPDQSPAGVSGGPTTTASPAPGAPAQAPSSTKICSSCGATISPSATFCYNCGAKQS